LVYTEAFGIPERLVRFDDGTCSSKDEKTRLHKKNRKFLEGCRVFGAFVCVASTAYISWRHALVGTGAAYAYIEFQRRRRRLASKAAVNAAVHALRDALRACDAAYAAVCGLWAAEAQKQATKTKKAAATAAVWAKKWRKITKADLDRMAVACGHQYRILRDAKAIDDPERPRFVGGDLEAVRNMIKLHGPGITTRFVTEAVKADGIEYEERRTALHIAAFQGLPSIVRCLLENGSGNGDDEPHEHAEEQDRQVRRWGSGIGRDPYFGESALLRAVRGYRGPEEVDRRAEVMSILLDAGAEDDLGPLGCSPTEVIGSKWDLDKAQKDKVLALFEGERSTEEYQPPKKYICWEIDADADEETRALINAEMEAINAKIAANDGRLEG
jgi:hypothetical protein